MSGDVQPRKRKDKKKKKDELSVEEPRGTAAALGEGDVFLHSHHDHGTGGHWCAKVIFFSLLAILITLIGLIILENRGLSELEANSVESRYSGVLEGWLEEAPDDDHHDIHTLELKHHDDDDGHGDGHNDHDDDDEVEDNFHEDEDISEQEFRDEDDDDEDEDVEANQDEASDEENDDDGQDIDYNNQDQDDEENEDDNNFYRYGENFSPEDDDTNTQDVDANRYEDDDDINNYYNNYGDDDEGNNRDDGEDNDRDDDEDNDRDDDEDKNRDDDGNNDLDDDINNDHDDDDEPMQEDNAEYRIYNDAEDNESFENQNIDGGIRNSQENYGQNNEEDEDEDEVEHEEVELEKLEQEPDDQEPISTDLPVLPEDNDDGDDDDTGPDASNEDQSPDDDDDDDDFLDQDEIDNELPVVERITVPPGKPLVEMDDEDSSEKPVNTLADEEEYERQQEELRRQQEEESHMWVKLGVGAALLLATHAVVRRAVAERDEPADNDDETVTEDTPTPERRTTLVQEQTAPPVKSLVREPQKVQEPKKIPSITTSAPTPIQRSLEEDEPEDEIQDEVELTPDKELHSDEEELEEEDVIVPKKEAPKQAAPPAEDKAESEGDDDVEIIEEEDLEEPGEEEVEEEEISDVDDAELLSRLEAKYGRLPEPERPGQTHKNGGNSIEDDDWPGEPSDAYWRQQLDSAERELRQGSWAAAAATAALPELADSGRARWIVARAHDQLAELKRDNKLLARSITAYLNLLKMNERMSDNRLLEITNRTIDRIYFRGAYLNAEPVYRLLIRRFPDNPGFRNNLTISFLMANRADLAVDVLKETIKLWPDDRVALAHYAFVLKTHFNRVEEAVDLFVRALDGDSGPANEPRFYYHLGDSLLLLGRYTEAHEVHKRAAALGHFLSPAQRSLYNVDRLKSRPWWDIEHTPYVHLARTLENSWKEILKEGEAARALYDEEKEGLREKGEWSQLDLFVRGREIPERCRRAPVTCGIVRAEAAAAGCKRGQVKFSSMEPGTHVRPHVGPTNCRLRMHLALSNTKDAYMRVDKEIRQWQVGKTWLFDDSFEHEVWHNGTKTRLVLIVDLWHPDLTPSERRTLPAI